MSGENADVVVSRGIVSLETSRDLAANPDQKRLPDLRKEAAQMRTEFTALRDVERARLIPER